VDRSERFSDRQANTFDSEANAKYQTRLKTVENAKKHLTGSDIVLDHIVAIKS
jgi:hypothetical protein